MRYQERIRIRNNQEIWVWVQTFLVNSYFLCKFQPFFSLKLWILENLHSVWLKTYKKDKKKIELYLLYLLHSPSVWYMPCSSYPNCKIDLLGATTHNTNLGACEPKSWQPSCSGLYVRLLCSLSKNPIDLCKNQSITNSKPKKLNFFSGFSRILIARVSLKIGGQ